MPDSASAQPARSVETIGVWVDLLNPEEGERAHAERSCKLRIPTREALSEIESSSRHYVEDGAIYLSTALLVGADGPDPRLTPVGFIVGPDNLVTVRFDRMRAFEAARQRLATEPPKSPLDAFVALMEEVIDRKADVLEAAGSELDLMSQAVFHRVTPQRRNHASEERRQTLLRVGRMGDRLSKMRASLLTTGRILAYVADELARRGERDLQTRLAAVREDVDSLTRFQENLANKTQFLLDAVLGFINIDQNDVIKVLTVVSVVGVPPTLVASIYGMNFKVMPELNWSFGYPYALALIVLSAVLPLAWFKVKGWF